MKYKEYCDQRAVEEFARRQDGEMEKAIAKYGEVALAPAGHPDYDIFDYLANELVGLKRYGEMTIARAELMYKTRTIGVAEKNALMSVGQDCIAFGTVVGIRLLSIQGSLRRQGLMLGSPEKSYKNDANPETVKKLIDSL